MSEIVEVKVESEHMKFAEDKDRARQLRKEIIMPALAANKRVVIDFSNVTSATQSFVHALVGEPLQKNGEAVLDRLEFRSCAPQIKSLVELVVDYSLSGFTSDSAGPVEVMTQTKQKPPSKSRAGRPRNRKRR